MGIFGRKDTDIHLTPDVTYITNPDVAHEHTDVKVKPIAWFVFALFVFGLVVCGLMYGLFKVFESRAQADELQASPLARRGEERLPPEPRLQAAPGFGVTTEDGERRDLSLKEPQAEYRVVYEMWKQELENYGWADEGAGRVRVPIEDAMKLYLQQQAQQPQGQTQQPAQPQQGQSQTTRETIPSPSSSGRQGEKKNQ